MWVEIYQPRWEKLHITLRTPSCSCRNYSQSKRNLQKQWTALTSRHSSLMYQSQKQWTSSWTFWWMITLNTIEPHSMQQKLPSNCFVQSAVRLDSWMRCSDFPHAQNYILLTHALHHLEPKTNHCREKNCQTVFSAKINLETTTNHSRWQSTEAYLLNASSNHQNINGDFARDLKNTQFCRVAFKLQTLRRLVIKLVILGVPEVLCFIKWRTGSLLNWTVVT